jgi:hypothetical protein
LYHILYDDGDEEDMDDKELTDVCAMFKGQKLDDSEQSGGDTEGSDYAISDEDDRNRWKKVPKRGRIEKSKKETNKHSGGIPIRKEEDTNASMVAQNTKLPKKSPNKRQPVNDVEALMETGAKGSVTAKTIDTAEKSLLKVAKKDLKAEAMKVTSYLHHLWLQIYSLIVFLSFSVYSQNTPHW